jgi:sensor histidine kinase regulating citrate/malate metabolism
MNQEQSQKTRWDTYEERLKNSIALKNRVTFFFVFFLAAICAVFIITSVLQVNTVTRYVCSELAMPTVKQAQELIESGPFEALTLSLNENDPYYEEARLKLLELKERTNCLYLYTMAPAKGTVFRYIIDGSASPEDEEFSAMGTEEDLREWDNAAMIAVTSKTIQLGTIDQTEQWGSTISAYGPILNSRGDLIGIIGCDLEASGIISWIKTQVLWQLGIVITVVLLGLFVYISLIRRINQIFA